MKLSRFAVPAVAIMGAAFTATAASAQSVLDNTVSSQLTADALKGGLSNAQGMILGAVIIILAFVFVRKALGK